MVCRSLWRFWLRLLPYRITPGFHGLERASSKVWSKRHPL
nr:MAG TPA: hypothetical protein [Caudoviricetes sp.]